MDMPENWLVALRAWAAEHQSIRELWLFGSRADGRSTPDSDVDLAIALTNLDWAFGTYMAKGDDWQNELKTIVGRDVDLQPILPGTKEDEKVRRTGCLLWSRSTAE